MRRVGAGSMCSDDLRLSGHGDLVDHPDAGFDRCTVEEWVYATWRKTTGASTSGAWDRERNLTIVLSKCYRAQLESVWCIAGEVGLRKLIADILKAYAA